MTSFLWDGPEDSDEEISELVPFKCPYETLKYSKNGIMKYVKEQIQNESKDNKKLRTMKLCGKWNRITAKMLKFNKMRLNLKLQKFMQKYLNNRQL